MTQEAHAELVADVLVAVSNLPGGLFWKSHSAVAVTQTRRVVRFNIKGISDIFGCYQGRAVGIECKTGVGNLNDDQKRFRDKLLSVGGQYIVARSVEQVQDDLRSIKAL